MIYLGHAKVTSNGSLLDCASQLKMKSGVYRERDGTVTPAHQQDSTLHSDLSIARYCCSYQDIEPEPESSDMYDQYRNCEQSGESSCKSSMRRTEQIAAVNVALGTSCRPYLQRSFPAVHITHHSIQGWAGNTELNKEPALNQRSDIVSPTPAGLESQDLVDQRKLGH
jgi:hypothetical protein